MSDTDERKFSELEVLFLGGNGYLGTILKNYILSHTNSFRIYSPTREEFDTTTATLEQFKRLLGREWLHVVDFTVTTPADRQAQKLTLSYINQNSTYVCINSYGALFPNVYKDEINYTLTKKLCVDNVNRAFEMRGINSLNVYVPCVGDRDSIVEDYRKRYDNKTNLYICEPNDFGRDMLDLMIQAATWTPHRVKHHVMASYEVSV